MAATSTTPPLRFGEIPISCQYRCGHQEASKEMNQEVDTPPANQGYRATAGRETTRTPTKRSMDYKKNPSKRQRSSLAEATEIYNQLVNGQPNKTTISFFGNVLQSQYKNRYVRWAEPISSLESSTTTQLPPFNREDNDVIIFPIYDRRSNHWTLAEFHLECGAIYGWLYDSMENYERRTVPMRERLTTTYNGRKVKDLQLGNQVCAQQDNATSSGIYCLYFLWHRFRDTRIPEQKIDLQKARKHLMSFLLGANRSLVSPEQSSLLEALRTIEDEETQPSNGVADEVSQAVTGFFNQISAIDGDDLASKIETVKEQLNKLKLIRNRIEGGLRQLQSSHKVVSSMQDECYKLDEPNDPSLYSGTGGDGLGITEVLKSVRRKYNHLESAVRLSRAAIKEDINMFECWLATQKSEIREKETILQRMTTMQDMNSTGN